MKINFSNNKYISPLLSKTQTQPAFYGKPRMQKPLNHDIFVSSNKTIDAPLTTENISSTSQRQEGDIWTTTVINKKTNKPEQAFIHLEKIMKVPNVSYNNIWEVYKMTGRDGQELGMLNISLPYMLDGDMSSLHYQKDDTLGETLQGCVYVNYVEGSHSDLPEMRQKNEYKGVGTRLMQLVSQISHTEGLGGKILLDSAIEAYPFYQKCKMDFASEGKEQALKMGKSSVPGNMFMTQEGIEYFKNLNETSPLIKQ